MDHALVEHKKNPNGVGRPHVCADTHLSSATASAIAE